MANDSPRPERTLSEFAAQHGTVDNLKHVNADASEAESRDRESTAGTDASTTPPSSADGHVTRDEIPDYWHNDATASDEPLSAKLVPQGRVTVVLSGNPSHVEPVVTSDPQPNPGVYLNGRDDYSTKPPHPVEVSDEHLRFAAHWALTVASKTLSTTNDVVCITKDYRKWVNIGRLDQPAGQETVFDGSEGEQKYQYGSPVIRVFDTPKTVYSDCHTPRLKLSALRDEYLEPFPLAST